MGSGNSKDFDTNALLRGGGHRMFANLGPWTLPQVKAVFKRFKKNDGNFGIERRQFLSLMSFKKPPVVDPGDIFNVLDTDHSGRIDCLEFVGMLGFCCDCPLDDKIEFLFEMCDFNMNGSLSQSEMVLMMSSTMRGLLKMSGTPIDTDIDANLEKVAIEAFDVADNNRSGTIEVNEFKTWLRNNGTLINQVEKMTRSVASAIQDRDCEDSAEEISDDELKGVKDAIEDDYINDRKDRSIEAITSIEQGNITDTNSNIISGDEFMATKPWLGSIVEPSGFKFDKSMNDPPTGNLNLEWVHGYRCFDSRNNIKALRKKDGTGRSQTLLVYPAAGVGVVYDKQNHKQKFYIGHTDDIISIAVLEGHIVATGQIGKNPEIHIWDTDRDNENIMTITGFHERGICNLAFSSDGQYLASIGLDNDHCIAVHNWKNNKLVASGKGDQQKVLDMCFSPNNDEICMVGQKFIKFFDLSNGNRSLKGKKAILGKLGKIQSYLSCSYFGDSVIVGTNNGELYQIQDNRLVSVIQAHSPKSAVNCIYTFPEGMISGGKDGTLKVWDSHFKEIQTIDLVALPSISSQKPEIRSICIESNDGSIYVGTRASEIIEIKQNDLNNSQVLMNGHYNGELWGLANHPSSLEYCTVGEDKMIMIWDVRTRRLLRTTKSADKAKCCAYSPNGEHIAVGLVNGMVQIFDNKTLSEITRFQHSSKSITVLTYSPVQQQQQDSNNGGCILAVGSRDQKIYLYIVKENKYGKKAICRGHSSYITHIDFSKDGKYLQSTCGAYELLFWNITGKRITSPTSLRDVEWATWTCPLGWPVQGIWPKFSDGTDINAVDRNSTSDEIVTADDFGMVKIFKYPCVEKNAGKKMYMGHSSHVTNVCYVYSDSYVISIGGNDKSIFQWSHDLEEEEDNDDDDNNNNNNNGNMADNEGGGDDDEEEGKITEEGIKQRELAHLVSSTTVPSGDEFMAVKPWLGSIFSPDNFKENPSLCDSPNVDVNLEWVYGYEAQSNRNNIRYTSLGEIIFHTAAVNIVYDAKGKKQRFNRDHNDDIISLACHPNGRYCATGEIGRKPAIIVYDTATMETEVILQNFHVRGVTQLAFNNEGNLLASVGEDDQHMIGIYDWKKKKLLYSAQGGQQKIFAMEYNPYNNQLVTCGDKHIKFWKLNGSNLKSQKGLFGKVSSGDKSKFYTLAFTPDYTISGSSNGKIYLWKGNQLSKMIDAHKGAIYCSYTNKELGIFLTGGRDGKVLRWHSDNVVKNSGEEVTGDSNKITSPIRSICCNKDHIVIGTQRAEIYELESENPNSLAMLLRGHYDGELWGLATNPVKEGAKEYATCGDDKRIYIWDCNKKQSVYEAIAGEKARTIEYSTDGKHLAVGLVNGNVEIYEKPEDKNNKQLNKVAQLNDSKQWISDIKYSPNGSLMAVGSHDNKIYLYNIDDSKNYTLKKKLTGHSSYITHLDFSSDSKHLQSNCGAYELLFWNTDSGKRENASSLKNMKWNSWTCTLGWPVQGIWLPESDGTDVNSCCRALYDKDDDNKNTMDVGVIATGDDYGKVNIFKYPCYRKGSGYHTYCGHSSHVTNVRFNCNKKRLFSVGGKDRSIFQWIIDIDTTDDDNDMAVPDTEENDEEADNIANNWFNTDNGERGGDEFMAVKPWVGAIKEPTTFKNDPNLEKEPNESLELEWVHGYSTGACRNNLGYSSEGDIVYHAAALGIIYDVDKHRMHFQRGHTDDITAFAINSDGTMVATGEIGKQPKICIWDAFSGCSIITIKGFHKRGINALSFSPDSSKIASIGLDDDHSLAIYRIDGTMVAKSSCSKAKILATTFLSNGTSIVTVGSKVIKFWNLSGSSLTSKNGVFGRNGTIQTILCSVPCGSDCVTSQLDGSLYLWKGNQCTNQVKRHKGAVYALNSTSDNGIISGGADGNIIIWGVSLTPLKTINLKDLKVSFSISSGVNALCYDKSHDKMLVGTRGSEILEIDTNNLSNSVLIRAHNKGELWGLAIHPNREHYATAGDDNTVRIWDARDRTMINMITLKGSARAIAYSQHGSHLALGMQSGSLIIYSSDLKEIISTCVCSKKWIQVIQYSKDSSVLAVGSHDNNIYLFNTAPYSRRSVLKGHGSYITHLDFSADGKYLQSNCGAYELLFWNVENGKQIKSASSVRDVKWATWTCTLGWPVQGIWPACSDGTDVNSVDRSSDEKLLVSADDFMQVKLFRYPCINKDNKYKSYGGHSSHVTNIRFSTSECYVLSCGGNDKCVFQFKVTR